MSSIGTHKVVFCLPTDLLNLVLDYDLCCTAYELAEDITFYTAWQNCVPPMFLSTSLLDTRFYFNVANPMIKFHPFTARRYLRMRPCDIWSQTLPALANMISKESIREMRTYKACVQRWVSDCVNNRQLFYYKILVKKALGKLTQCHFRPNHPGFFVLEALRQVDLFLAS